MPNYAEARKSMVDSQIHTMGVVTSAVLDAFRTVPREMFVPESMRSIAYVDEDLQLGDGRVLIEPALLARMVEAAEIAPSDTILNLGDSTGYSTAILSMLAAQVVTPDQDRDGQVYNLIFVSGSVYGIPAVLMNKLSTGGRMVAVLRPSGTKVGMVTIAERLADGQYATRKLFDAATPYIKGFEPPADFVF